MPNRVIYSYFMQCLIAVVESKFKPTLTFINPDTRKGIGRPANPKRVD
jgi:hypothetical protein